MSESGLADDVVTRVRAGIEDFRAGRMVILADDEDRENEGDVCIAASHCTAEAVNFMARHARGLICLAITLVQVKGRWRTILLVPTIYLAAFVWETRLVVEPSITRQLMIGAILIVMMISRPQGLLGQRRVEVAT